MVEFVNLLSLIVNECVCVCALCRSASVVKFPTKKTNNYSLHSCYPPKTHTLQNRLTLLLLFPYRHRSCVHRAPMWWTKVSTGVKSQVFLSQRIPATLILDVPVSLRPDYLWLNVPWALWKLPSFPLGEPGLHQQTPQHSNTKSAEEDIEHREPCVLF